MNKETIRPEYYNTDSVYEPIKIIQHYGLCFEIANNLKYCLRAGVKNKDTEIEDLVKAKTYLQLRIDYLESQKSQNFKKGGVVLNPDKPKSVHELKVGDEIKAIDECVSNDDKSKLTIGKSYKIQQISSNMIRITNDSGNDYHWFSLDNLDKYFHVTK